jgi:hypothetical protein
MLNGTFNSLFDDSKVRFNAYDGSFTIQNTEKGKINVKGEGDKKYWTEKALIRAGYCITESKSEIEVEVPSDSDKKWKCYSPGYADEFNSIYEMITWIRNRNLIS